MLEVFFSVRSPHDMFWGVKTYLNVHGVAFIKKNFPVEVKVKISLFQAVEAHRVARG
jgi:hypothetical protein